MIVYPVKWEKDYGKLADNLDIDVDLIINELISVLKRIHVNHLAYSGGLDSTIMLCLLSCVPIRQIHTYTISSRASHPDIQFARIGSRYYDATHHEFIVKPTRRITDKFVGDNAVRQFFGKVHKHTDEIICCDGIDEFMCGYYDHMSRPEESYKIYLSKLTSDHLIPLDYNSRKVKVFLPYLDRRLVSLYRMIPLRAKVSSEGRKLVMKAIARQLSIPSDFVDRNKYGFCDAFIDKDKKLA